MPPTPSTGVAVIRRYVSELPNLPGVYRMIDTRERVLYVGKARDLKKRVGSYVRTGGLTTRIARMIGATASMEFIVTKNESEALLVEANLIKTLEPRYNILMRDDKSFPYLQLTGHAFPRIRKHRGPQDKGGEYFGPFASVGDLNKTITQMQRAFLLRPCSDNILEHRKRPCLQYQIKRCSAPCVRLVDETEYAALVKDAKAFLRGNSRTVQQRLLGEMQVAAEKMEYERAARIRNRLKALTQVQQEQGLTAPTLKDSDVIALAQEPGGACVQVFFFRDGQNFGNKSFFPTQAAGAEPAVILETFLTQFYSERTPPRELLLSHKLEEESVLETAFTTLAGRRVGICFPIRGDKKEVVDGAVRNAKMALKRHLDRKMGESALLDALTERFDLPKVPQRIEVYDNSHISGTHAVGGMIVAGPDGFMKQHYRKFNIKEAQTNDDFGMMQEVLKRRLSRLKKESSPSPLEGEGRGGGKDSRSKSSRATPPPNLPPQGGEERESWPDLLIIDGGAGQLSAALAILDALELREIPIVGIAKGPDRNAGRERFFLPNQPDFQMPMGDPLLHYLQRLRDEAHRFAIGTHRAKRSSAIKQSQLDTIEGIGGVRKKALLHHFGSAKAVSNASAEELARVPGISKALADNLWRQFHG